MHMSSMDTSSITAHHGTVQHSTAQYSTVGESRFLAILGFSKLLIILPKGGGVGVAATPISSDGDGRRFWNFRLLDFFG